jgi:hypothetical protein
MVEKYIEYIGEHKEINPKQDMSVFEAFLYGIIEKFIDQKQQSNALKCYYSLFEVQQIDCIWLLKFLFNNQSYMSRQLHLSSKHAVPRLTIVLKFLKDITTFFDQKRISGQTFPCTTIYPQIKMGLDANGADQRQICQ